MFADGRIYFRGWGDVDTWKNTGININGVDDTAMHRISISWDSASGKMGFYLDGDLAGETTANQGKLFPSTGNISFAPSPDVAISDIRILVMSVQQTK